ncbi:hypothetical protein Tco_1245352 [Tanacetum coccineum]
MADLKFVDQHNMVACLEKTEENAEFHQIVDFLSTCSINYALTVSPTIYASYIEQFWNTATSKTVNSMKQIHAIVDGKAMVISESLVRSDLLFNDEDGIACLTNDEIFENLALMGYEQLSTKLTFQKGKVTPLFDSMLVQNQAPEGEGSAIPPKPQPTPSTSQPNISEPQTEPLQTKTHLTVSHELQTEAHIEQILPSPSTYQRKQRKTQKHRRTKKVTELPQTSVTDPGAKIPHLGGVDAQTRPETMSRNTSRRREDIMEYHDDLIDFVPPTPHALPLSGEEAKTAQDRVITRLKLRVKRLEKKRKARTLQPMKRRLFKGRVETSTNKSLGEDASKQERNDDKTEELNLTDGADTEVIIEDKGSGEKGGNTADQVSTAMPEVSTASVPVKVSVATPSTPLTTTTIFGDEDCVLVEEEPEKPVKVKRRDQGLAKIKSDAELAQRLHEEELAESDKAQKERQKQEEATSAALAEEFDEIQAKIDADHELAKKETIGSKKSRENKEQTTYKNSNQEQDDYLPQTYGSKKQKLEEDNDAKKEKLRDSMDVVPRDDVAIDVESLATKYPIMEVPRNYKIFSEMLDDFDRQDVIDLHRLVNERYETTSLEGYDLLLWGDLKTLFEPNEEDEIWKNQQDYNLISWRLFDSCGVHVLLMNTGVAIHMMIEKKYPLTQEMLSRMLNRRLEVDYESEMAFELLRFTRSQLQK